MFIYPFIICFCVVGIGFPTCISVNNCVCHFSPLHSEPDVVLQNGDMVKMYDTVHIASKFSFVWSCGILFTEFVLHIFYKKTIILPEPQFS